MENLIVTIESHLTFRDKTTGKIMGIEDQSRNNLERYGTEIMNNGGSQELFGVKISGNPSKL